VNLNGGNRVTVNIRVEYDSKRSSTESRLNDIGNISHVELISNVTGTPGSTKIFTSSDWEAVDGWLEMSCDMILTQDT
jgi:hypothetical protein